MKKILISLLLVVATMAAFAQRGDYAKMSSMVRRLAVRQHLAQQRHVPEAEAAEPGRTPSLCAFVRIDGNADSLLQANGCRALATLGDISIADIPLNRLNGLSLERRVSRIEAKRGMELHLDTMAIMTNATDAYTGRGLPQAFTGKGVVMGIQDVGFDVTHPTFRNADQSATRIRRFWDQLSTDTVGSSLYVGNDYATEEAILGYGGSRDETLIFHGTHTTGIAAGNGAGTKFCGMAPESDLCLVSNAVTDDIELIAESDLYKYTYATDALGFKYIFDYAEQQGKPCVISFSEGSRQDLHGDDLLYYEMLERLTGPGRIIVSSAGNRGHIDNYLFKQRGCPSAGTCINQGGSTLGATLSSADKFSIRVVAYGEANDTLTFRTSDIVAATDSLITDTVTLCGKAYAIDLQAYPSCYDTAKTAFDLYIQGEGMVGVNTMLSLEILGEEAEVEAFATLCNFYAPSHMDGRLADADKSHGINSPSSAPCVICVGATSYRGFFTNIHGEKAGMSDALDNSRSWYSSLGPTFDGRTKPDVMAPGTSIISSMGSHYLANCVEVPEEVVDITYFQGREYPWSGDSGTSMASPAVGGIIALWLEADPTLTPDDIRGILARTCRHHESETEWPNNRYGYGIIDAYAGLLDILGLTGIDGLSAQQPSAVTFRVIEGGFEVATTTPLPSPASLRVYATNGSLIHQATLPAGQTRYTVRLDGTKKGVVAVQIDGATPSLSGSSLLRI